MAYQDANFLQEGIRLLGEMIMDLGVSEQIRAGKHERNPQRRMQGNGYREREGYEHPQSG